eukprot:9238151-Pyramimonas_sp.AAC.1
MARIPPSRSPKPWPRFIKPADFSVSTFPSLGSHAFAPEEEEGVEENEDQSTPTMHQQCCNTPSRPKPHPHASVQ